MKYLYFFVLWLISSCIYADTENQVITEAKLQDHNFAHINSLVAMTDDELSETQGQALYSLNRQNQGGLSFYTLSMEANIGLNANIKNLQLGCGGVNSSSKAGCDIDIQNVSFGCIANASGTCITIPKSDSRQPDGAVQEVQAGDKAQGQMKDFNLTNPFYQFAIKNADSASTREVVGVRIGAAEVEGPMSFGALTSFSGYLTGFADLEMQGQGNLAGNLPNNLEDVAVTCKAPNLCANASGQSAYQGMADYRYLGLDNATECVIPIIACAQFRQLTIKFSGVKRTNLPVVVSGNRQSQAFVLNANLGMGTGGVVKSITDSMQIERTTNAFGSTLLNIVLGLIKTSAGNKITNQLAEGLGTTVASLNNNSYQLPYNLSNVHQLDVKSNVFGLSLQKQSIQYPGYVAPVSTGWAMYIPEGFKLNISDRTTTFVQNIVNSNDARNGNAVMLQAPYRNCYGTLTFC